MFRLLFTSLLVVGMFFAYSNFTNIEEAYYDATEAVTGTGEQATSEIKGTINQRIDKFVRPAKDAYGSVVSERDQAIESNLE